MKKIREFLAGLSDLEYRYLRLQCQMANEARELTFKFNISKEEFCDKLGIALEEYDAYMTGGYDYTIMHMAKIQALFIDYQKKEALKEASHRFTSINVDESEG